MTEDHNQSHEHDAPEHPERQAERSRTLTAKLRHLFLTPGNAAEAWTYDDLAAMFQSNRGTVQRAIDTLRAERLVTTSLVVQLNPDRPRPSAPGSSAPPPGDGGAA